jgi:hypothetical protein
MGIEWEDLQREIGLCDYHANLAQSMLAPVMSSSGPKTAAATEAKPKRGPGRPRKTETATEAKPKRGPGRPRKTETATEAKPKRGPGRPRKTETATEAKPKRGKSSKVDLAAVREWAWSAGFEVGERGRIPSEIIDKYKQQAA